MDSYRFIYLSENKKVFGEIRNNRLIDYGDINSKIEGNIYRARVEKYINSLDAYIIDLGLQKKAILKRKFCIGDNQLGKDIIVEILRVPKDHKMIEVTEKITLTDGYIVLSPFSKANSMFEYNFYKRTKAKYLSDDEINFRYKKLVDKFKLLIKEKYELPTPKLLISDKFIRNYIIDYDGKTVSNVKGLYSSNFDKNFNPDYIKEISLDLSILRGKTVTFSNGNLVIDRLEALTVIDINSNAIVLHKTKEEMSKDVNLASIEEIAIQIKLRDIDKMVLIDFIRVDSETQKIIYNEIVNTFKKFHIKFKVLGFTKMGLFEVIIY